MKDLDKMKKENKKFNLKNEYIKSWKYLKESQKFIWAAVTLFFITALIGFFIQPPESVSIKILEFIKELIEKTQNMSQGELVSFIFFNNLQSSFIGIISGFFLGIFPLISTIANGYILGFVSKLAVNAEGFSSLLRLLPHGIFELPAIFISFGLGIKFGTFIFQKNKSESFKIFLWNSIRVFLTIVIPLLIIAGIIEGSLIFLLN